MERMMQAYRKEEGLATDAETVCYLYTAAFRNPLDHEHTNIYLHLAAKLLREEKRDVPADLDFPEELSRYEQGCLAELKRKIWNSAEMMYRGKKRE